MLTQIVDHGYTFILKDGYMEVYDYDVSLENPVAIVPLLDNDGKPFVFTQEDFEIEIAYWLREALGL